MQSDTSAFCCNYLLYIIDLKLCTLHCVSKKFKIFHNFCIIGKRIKFATKPIWHYPPHLRNVATLPWGIKSSNFWPPVNCACVPQRFNSLLTLRLVQLFSGNSSANLFAVYPFKYKPFIEMSSSLNTMFIVDKHCSDICCDEFSMPQIDRKVNKYKNSHMKNYICKRLAILAPKISKFVDQ